MEVFVDDHIFLSINGLSRDEWENYWLRFPLVNGTVNEIKGKILLLENLTCKNLLKIAANADIKGPGDRYLAPF